MRSFQFGFIEKMKKNTSSHCSVLMAFYFDSLHWSNWLWSQRSHFLIGQLSVEHISKPSVSYFFYINSFQKLHSSLLRLYKYPGLEFETLSCTYRKMNLISQVVDSFVVRLVIFSIFYWNISSMYLHVFSRWKSGNKFSVTLETNLKGVRRGIQKS